MPGLVSFDAGLGQRREFHGGRLKPGAGTPPASLVRPLAGCRRRLIHYSLSPFGRSLAPSASPAILRGACFF